MVGIVQTPRRKAAVCILLMSVATSRHTCKVVTYAFPSNHLQSQRLGQQRMDHHHPSPTIRPLSTFPTHTSNSISRHAGVTVAGNIHSRSSYRWFSTKTTKTRLHSTAGSHAAIVAAASSNALSPISWFYLSLLAIQFGCQPILTKKFAPSNIVRSTYVLSQDIVRFVCCCLLLIASGSWESTLKCWTIKGALLGAGIPSILYVIQNYCSLMAYQNLPPVTYNVLNQTKTLSAALCCFLIMGKKQSIVQLFSLALLLLSALIVEKVVPLSALVGTGSGANKEISKKKKDNNNNNNNNRSLEPKSDDANNQFYLGVIPVLLASFISGLAGALTQRALQTKMTNAFVFSMELSIFSILVMMISLLLGSPDGKRIRNGKMIEGWTWKTWIPIITNACGGVVVGLVTKHAGAVRKGFALIFGLLLSGVLQSYLASSSSSESGDKISTEQVVGGVLASISLWMHSKYPPV